MIHQRADKFGLWAGKTPNVFYAFFLPWLIFFFTFFYLYHAVTLDKGKNPNVLIQYHVSRRSKHGKKK